MAADATPQLIHNGDIQKGPQGAVCRHRTVHLDGQCALSRCNSCSAGRAYLSNSYGLIA